MARGERAVDRGLRRGRAILVDLGEEARRARLERGLSQAVVAEELGISRNQLRRIERGEATHVAVMDLARLLSVLGLDLWARAYPGGSPLRDAAHLALLRRLHQRLPDSAVWASETPLPGDRDQRAWDAVIAIDGIRIGVEAETRLTDVQSVLRRIDLKQRDDAAIARVVLLLADTRLNRAALREFGALLAPAFPVPSVVAIQALAHGVDPRGNAVILQ